ncbi:MAG TPA: thiamine phosphate synthase [Bryobacteraceae bacterium]|nr:thiamine phosphate synthase [Bryobacteraceae bacterium]
MKLPKLYPILDTGIVAERGFDTVRAAAAFLEGGAGILQLRHKEHWSRAALGAARHVADLCREAGVLLIIDDRADIAMLLEAGLHVGQDDQSPRDARRLMGTGAVIGFSSHNARQVCAAGGEPVDYLAFGPIFATQSKRNPDPVTGIEGLKECRALLGETGEKPLVAIGGIARGTARQVLAAGADSVAVIGDLLPAELTSLSLRRRMDEWQQLLK